VEATVLKSASFCISWVIGFRTAVKCDARFLQHPGANEVPKGQSQERRQQWMVSDYKKNIARLTRQGIQ
jgi:hypothetical protein